MVFEEKIFKYFFQKYFLNIAMATNQILQFGQKLIGIIEDYSSNISVDKKSKNNCREIAKTAAFHFSHYISMETISCYTNLTAEAIAIKKTTVII